MLFLLQLPSPFLLETAEHSTISAWPMHRPGMTYSRIFPCFSVENCLDDRGCEKRVAWCFSPAAAVASQTQLARQINETRALSCSSSVSFLGPVRMIASVTRTSGTSVVFAQNSQHRMRQAGCVLCLHNSRHLSQLKCV